METRNVSEGECALRDAVQKPPSVTHRGSLFLTKPGDLLLRDVKNGRGQQDELKQHARKQTGAIATRDTTKFTPALPKTPSRKIMRRLLRDIAANRNSGGDVTTLKDAAILEKLREEGIALLKPVEPA